MDIPPELIARLVSQRRPHVLPALLRPLAQAFAQQAAGVLFPHFANVVVSSDEAVEEDLEQLAHSLERLVHSLGTFSTVPAGVVKGFLARLSHVHDQLIDDAQAIFEGDPAAHSVDEVVLTYPGFFAIVVFRIAHTLHELGLPVLPRLLTEFAHEKTGIDIHPGAHIGRRFCIDHGTGIVVGETTVIGSNVKLYQGVTLGALTVEKSLANSKRHPTIEDDVVIYAGATILGGATVVGHHSVIGGNAFLTQSVPPNSVVTRQSEVRQRRAGNGFDDIEFII